MKYLLTFISMLAALPVAAQELVKSPIQTGPELGSAFRKDNYSPAVIYYQLLNLGKRALVSLGWMAKLANIYDDNLALYMAPARLTREATGFSALRTPLVPANLDTVRLDYVSSTYFNWGLRAELHLGGVDVGGSADMLGLAFGKTCIGRVLGSSGYSAPAVSQQDSSIFFTGASQYQRMHPTGLNLQLLGDNTIGNLTTELYVRSHLSKRLAIKGGYQWQTAELYFLDIRPADGNKRYRHRIGMPFLALTFPFI